MTRHFDFLFKDDEGDFFQKVALDESGVRANQRPPAMAKTAAPVKPAAPGTAFEKVASRLDRDLELLRDAGPIGLSGGMQKRACAYLEVVEANADLTPEQLGEVFDKVASAAIQTDLAAAYDQLCEGLPQHEHSIVDEVLIKIGHELVESAMLEKEARGLNMRALRGIEEAAHSTKALGRGAAGAKGFALHGVEAGAQKSRALNRGVAGAEEFTASNRAAKTIGLPQPPTGDIGAAAKVRAGVSGAASAAGAGVKAVGRTIAKPFQTAAGKVRKWNADRITSAPEKLESALAKSRAAEAAGGLKGTVAQGASKSLEKQHAAAVAKRDAKLNPAPKTDAPAAKAQAKTTAADKASEQGAAKAQEAAKPPGQPPKDKDKAGDDGGDGGDGGHEQHAHTPPPPGGAEGKPPGFMDAWKKATEGGWKSLSPQEKGALIRGGVTAALVTRAVTGHGAITGGEGLI